MASYDVDEALDLDYHCDGVMLVEDTIVFDVDEKDEESEQTNYYSKGNRPAAGRFVQDKSRGSSTHRDLKCRVSSRQPTRPVRWGQVQGDMRLQRAIFFTFWS